MKGIFFLTIHFSLLTICCFSQAGEWTWMKGGNNGNASGNFGTQGVPDPNNTPPTLYGAVPWTDLDGNFWIYGGFDNIPAFHNALWKYDVATNTWTWMKGSSSTNQTAIYGTQGIPDINNAPGGTVYGCQSWTDVNGDLWMYGGYGVFGPQSDLWRYHIATNEWTWMQGPGIGGQNPVYGTFQVPDNNNTPGGRWEGTANWSDANGNFWFYGGWDNNSSPRGDLWKYDASLNQWAWMSGDNTALSAPDYGIKGVPAASNQPGSRMAYCSFTDAEGNFWYFGGGLDASSSRNDLWKFDPSTLLWTWINGTNQAGNTGTSSAFCSADTGNLPSCREENRSRWTDACGNFWIFGGARTSTVKLNDLWVYRPSYNDWTFVNGTLQTNQAGIYGTQGVSNPANRPGARYGASTFTDTSGNLWLFGGMGTLGPLNDLWRFVPDTSCPGGLCTVNIISAPMFASSDTDVCEKFCVDFFDSSTNNPVSWLWLFPGGIPSASTDQNPSQICYQTPGIYDVTLITTNASGSDTLTLSNYITVYATPPFPAITQNGYTLTSSSAISYQWQFNSVDIPGATNQSYDVQQSGYYTVFITDQNGCVSSTTTYILIDGIDEANSGADVLIYPNPTKGNLTIELKNDLTGESITINVLNTLGQLVFSSEETISSATWKKEIALKDVIPGIYFIEIKMKKELVKRKIVVEK